MVIFRSNILLFISERNFLMKTSIKAIIAAAATAALSLGIAAAALAESGVKMNNPPIVEKDIQMDLFVEEDNQMDLLSAKEVRYGAPEEAYTLFEEKVLSGFGTYEDAKNNKDENGYVNINLVPLTVEDYTFGINGSRFFLGVPESFMTSFNEPESFDLLIGTEGKMTAKSDYSSNPMRVKIVITFDENGKIMTKTLNYNGVGKVNAPLIWDGDESPAEIAYFYYMEDGSGNIVEAAAVDLVRVD